MIVHAAPAASTPRGRQGLPGARRVPHRGLGHQHRLPARLLARPGGGGGRGPHPLRRRAHGRAGRRAARPHPKLYFDAAARGARAGRPQRAGCQVDAVDPLAVLALGKQEAEQPPRRTTSRRARKGPGRCARRCRARSSASRSTAGDAVRAGQALLIMEAMKMEHVIAAEVSGYVRAGHRRGRATRSSRTIRWPSSRRPTSTAARRARPRRRSTSTTSAPTWPRCSSATRMTLDAARPEAVGPAAQDRPAHGAREHRRPARSRQLRRIRRRWSWPRAGGATRLEELIATHAGRRPDHRPRPRSTATCSATRTARVRGDGLRLHRAGRHPGRPTTTGRSTG